MNSRQDILAAVSQSRKATGELAILLQKETLSPPRIARCLSDGALLEEVTISVERRGQKTNVSGVSYILEKDDAEVMRLCYLAPALDVAPRQGWLQSCLYSRAFKCFDALLSEGALAIVPDENRVLLLQLAVNLANPVVVRSLLLAGVDPFTKVPGIHKEDEETVLHSARDPESARLLLEAGLSATDLNSRNQPALGSVLTHTLDYARTPEEIQKGVDVAHLLLDMGSPIVSPLQTGHWRWSALDSMMRSKHSDAGLMHRIALLDPEAAQSASPRTSAAALDLLDTGVIEDLENFSKNIQWASFPISTEQDKASVHELFLRGVPPPSLFQISSSYHRAWMEVGIPISSEQIETVLYQASEDEEREISTDWSGLKDESLVRLSNARAGERNLMLNTPVAPARSSMAPRL